MEVRAVEFIVAACAGNLLKGLPQTLIGRVCTDSRQTQKGDLFFALRGDRFDGHNFLGDVVRKGAAAVVVERRAGVAKLPDCAVVAVEDARQALGLLASAYRAAFALPVVAVCGSNGKTSTKELLASVLKQKLATLWSDASFNNEIGVPMTLLRLEATHQVAVVEAGTNHPGELAPLLRMIAPRYGVLTNLGREHLEFFGDMRGVAEEEGALAEALPESGKLFTNGDDPWSAGIVGRTRAAVARIGFGCDNDWRARDLRVDKQGVSFRVEGPRAELAGEYRVALLGRHQVLNALLAVAAGAELGLTHAEIERGLAQCKPAKMRMEVWECGGVCVLDDAYNANADSMAAALHTLQELPCKGRRVAVLGDMAELGGHSDAAHEEVGRRAAELGVNQLFAVGKMAGVVARGARGAGLNRVFEFAEVETAAAAVKSFLKSGDVVLLKASRASRLERIGQSLRGAEGMKKN